MKITDQMKIYYDSFTMSASSLMYDFDNSIGPSLGLWSKKYEIKKVLRHTIKNI